MIKDVFFTLRIIILTLLVAMLLQVRVGEKTIDDSMLKWIQGSIFVDFLQETIDGGIVVTKALYKKTDTGIHNLLAKISRKREPGHERGMSFTLKRHSENEDGEETASAPKVKTAAPKLK